MRPTLLALLISLFFTTACEEKKPTTTQADASSLKDNTAKDNTAKDNTAKDNTAKDNTAKDNTAKDNTAKDDKAPADNKAAMPDMAPPPPADAKLVPQPGAKVGDATLCPSTADRFIVAADSPFVEHEGQKIYFCCDGCQGTFAKDPAGSLAKINAQIAAQNAPTP